MLQLVIGLTSVSPGLLLGIFMGGMCLDSLLLPRVISPRFHPLRVYGLLELGIALVGVVILYLVPWVSDLYTVGTGRGISGMLLRGTVAAVCLLPPTLLMGATLPAMARWIESTREGVSWLGFFYGGNIAGAVFGCLFAGFYLLRVHDMATATYAAAGINIAVALFALALAARAEWTGGVGKTAEFGNNVGVSSSADRTTNTPASSSWPVYITIAISGMTALGAEVVWTRLLSLLIGATVYTFSIILAVFLTGLGIGSAVGSILARSMVRPGMALVGCQLLLAGAISWAAYMISNSLPFWPINPTLSLGPWYNFQLDLARCLWTVLPAAVLWGASFPLALAAIARRDQDSGRLVGGVYAANTVGAILGAVVFSLIVVPTAGTQAAHRVLIGLCSLASITMIVALVRRPCGAHTSLESPPMSLVSVAARVLGMLSLGAWLIYSVAPAPWGMIAYGRFAATYGNRFAPGIRDENAVPDMGGPPDIFCTYVGEGMNGTIAVTKWTSGVRNFHSAGKVQASSDSRDMRLQRMLGHLSALTHPNPESVLVVACGAGVTAGSFVVHPEVKRIVICDIEPLVPKIVAPMFSKENFNVVTDPRTEIVADDGRHFIRTSREKFDIITSDPIDPWVKGCAALNTIEYYEMCKARLKPGGVMSLWIPLYESNPETVKSLISTFFQVFPHGTIWSNDDGGEGYDAVLLGQAEPTQFDLGRLQARLNSGDHARVRQSMTEVGFHSVIDLLGTYAGRADDLQSWMRGAQINTDRNLRLQYLAGMSANSFMSAEILNEITRHRKFPELLFTGSNSLTEGLQERFFNTPASCAPSDRRQSGADSNDSGPTPQK